MTNKPKIIIDTDPGHDDAMALMLAVKSQAFDILAVTTVCGNSTIQNTTKNAAYILDVLKADIPLYSGAEKPLQCDLIQAVVHGQSGLEGVNISTNAPLTNNAADKIIELIKANPGEVTIVRIGPLTNIATAMQKDPVALRQVKQIVSMVGAIEVAGNKNRVAEFNAFVDPEALAIVLDLPTPKTIVPLDACNEIQIPFENFEQLQNPELKSLLLRMNKPYIKNLQADMDADGALMYDALAIYSLLEPEACEVEDLNIQVETTGEITRGMTVVDRRPVPDDIPPNVNVVMRINQRAFTQRFFTDLNR